MKKVLRLIALMTLISNLIYAQQSDADKLKVDKPKILSKLDRLALAQITINYKLTTTAKVVSKGNQGTVAGARVSAYLETTDGELTEGDFQEVSDYFYSYFQKTLKSNGIDTVAWSSITATDFYKSADDKEVETQEGKKEMGGNAWVTNTAHKGNILHGKELAFAFAKIKKASNFCEEIGAPAGFFYLTLDFADVLVNLDIKETAYSDLGNGWYRPSTKSKKYSWAVNPEMRVGQPESGYTLFWNKKSQAEILFLTSDIEGKVKYQDYMGEDVSKARSGLAKQFAFRKELTPVLIETTKGKYKEAAKKTLEKYADAFVAKTKLIQKK
jgi:hypothetical protein